jgi:hypothetical protein
MKNCHVGFEVLTAVIMKSTIFWDITPCSSLSVNRRFGGTYRLHLQGQKIRRARNMHLHQATTTSTIQFISRLSCYHSTPRSLDTVKFLK